MRLMLVCGILWAGCAKITLGARAAEPVTKPVAGGAAALTPGEALERVMQASAEGDEGKFRQVARIKSQEGFSEGATRWAFASARLHRAVREHRVSGRRVREAGFDREYSLSPDIPAPMAEKDWEALWAAIRKVEWEVEGDAARPKGNPNLLGDTQGTMSVVREGGGWVVVLSDPKSGEAEQLRSFAKSFSKKAAAIDAAAEGVKAGTLKTIGEVNAFVEAEVRKGQAVK